MKMIDVYALAERMNVKVMRAGSKIMIDDWHVTGTTKGEASDWIDRNMQKAHETIDQYEATHA